MKTAVGVVVTMMMTAMAATEASAEWRLYVNRDNRAWALERVYVSNDECDRAARSLYKSGQALGVGCAEYPQQAQAPAAAQRPAEITRPAVRHIPRADETTTRVSTSRPTPRAAEYVSRPTSPRRVAAEAPAAQSHPAAVIFLPSGGIELQTEEAPNPTPVASPPTPRPRRRPAPAAQAAPDDDRTSTAVALAKAATEGTAASAREVAAETAKREAEVTADKAERRTHLTVFGGVMLVLGTGLVYSVSRVARTSPLRGLAVCLIELGLFTAALAYPVVAMWTKLTLPSAIVLSPMPGVLAGLVIGAVGVVALAVELTRKPTRPKPAAVPVPARDAAASERKPQAPVEPVKPAEPVGPLQPIRPLDAVHTFDAPEPEPPRLVESAKRPEATQPAEAPKRPAWAKQPEAAKQP